MINKMKSRKLIAWIVWTIIFALIFIFRNDLLDSAIGPYSIVTFIYIGGQAAIDGIEKYKKRGM